MADSKILDEFALNKFIEKINDKNGKVIKIDTIQKINSERWSDDGLYSGIVASGTSTSSNNYFLIHYKSKSKVEYNPLEDKEYQNLSHEFVRSQKEEWIKDHIKK